MPKVNRKICRPDCSIAATPIAHAEHIGMVGNGAGMVLGVGVDLICLPRPFR